jgi:hypothetical protein
VDTKLDVYCKQYCIDVADIRALIHTIDVRVNTLEKFGAEPIRGDIEELRKSCDAMLSRVNDLDKTRAELIEKAQVASEIALRLRVDFDKWKLIWGIVSIIVLPIATTVILLLFHALIGF